jgi:hypothetical protein
MDTFISMFNIDIKVGVCCGFNLLTYYYFIVAASSFNTPLERRAPNGRPATVLHYYTVLIKELFNGDKQYIPVLNRELCSMATQTIHSMD